ncbi:hypothetical protein [Haloarchaeobius sp. DYHT-AS-18]|uniref:hypothetical protein n=1 Tax=Haloarchaeobius sp. DYHT-AS-18 TaxID=3446117 RepID=UPI003EBA53D4
MYRNTTLDIVDERADNVEVSVRIRSDRTGRGYAALVFIEVDTDRWEFGVLDRDGAKVAEQIDDQEQPVWMESTLRQLGLGVQA